MSGRRKPNVLELPLFRQRFRKLSDRDQQAVADEIDLVIENPLLGEQKKGYLSHVRVHKFPLNNAQDCWRIRGRCAR